MPDTPDAGGVKPDLPDVFAEIGEYDDGRRYVRQMKRLPSTFSEGIDYSGWHTLRTWFVGDDGKTVPERDLAEAVGLLREVEWEDAVELDGAHCSSCRSLRTKGHHKSCRLDAFLARFRKDTP